MEDQATVAPLDPEKLYYSCDELPLDTEQGPKTLKMGVWICVDPVRIITSVIWA